jgi:hypothetical protein
VSEACVILGDPVEGSSFPLVLEDADTIASYIEELASDYVDVEFMTDYYRGAGALLRSVPVSDLKPGDADHNRRSRAKEKKYALLPIETMPPIVVTVSGLRIIRNPDDGVAYVSAHGSAFGIEARTCRLGFIVKTGSMFEAFTDARIERKSIRVGEYARRIDAVGALIEWFKANMTPEALVNRFGETTSSGHPVRFTEGSETGIFGHVFDGSKWNWMIWTHTGEPADTSAVPLEKRSDYVLVPRDSTPRMSM